MPEPTRLDGLLVDPSRSVTFTFEGAPFSGLAGDTIASALAANGQWMLSRSFKYRRPRGVFSMAGHDANTLVQLPDEPNVPADLHPISDGLAVLGQNYEGSLARDRGAWLGRMGRFLPPGFYYKAFFRPRGAWRLWEPLIRRKAGLGRVDTNTRHKERDKAYAFAATVVIGGGPAGMAAALRAAVRGGEVILVDDHPVLGGALVFARFDVAGTRGRGLREDLVAQVKAAPTIEVWTNATCHSLYDDNWLAVVKQGRLVKLRAGNVVVATGAIELPVVFRNGDLPGVMLCSAAQRLLRLYGVRPGGRAVVATANEHGYGAALDLAEAGVAVAAVCDLRAAPPDGELRRAVRDLGVTIHDGHTVWEAAGSGHVEGVVIAPITGEGQCGRPIASVACDLVCLGAGYTPNAALLHHAGARFRYDERVATHFLEAAPINVEACGSVAACFDLDGALTGDNRRPDDGLSHPWPMFAHPKGMEFVDLDEDLTITDIEATAAEGYDHIQLLKRFSTTGMGPSQGRLSNVAAIRLVARATGRTPDAVG
ncbi:MAG: 2Fe-2S iron-sulfur cluster-binding protein, partial [Alphaproteobacteria bacterium]